MSELFAGEHVTLSGGPIRLVLGNCIEVMQSMPEDSIDSIVTDPPYGLEFMGKEWDSFRVDPRVARWSAEKSGGAGAQIKAENSNAKYGRVAFHKRRTTSTCRTCGKRDAFRNPHACGERADWVNVPVDRTPVEARAFQNWCELWGLEAYRVLKPGGHILAFGGSRTHHRLICGLEDAGFEVRDCCMWLYGSGFPKSLDVSKAIDRAAGAERAVLGGKAGNSCDGNPCTCSTDGRAFHATKHSPETAPATEAAEKWSGWGTALKPAWEAILVARKPLGERSIAANVQRHGTGAINVDACRGDADLDDTGRWPANILLDEVAAALLDHESMEGYAQAEWPSVGESDFGGASRFFYTAKVDTTERNAGLEGFDLRVVNEATPPGTAGSNSPRAGASRSKASRNHHPTVKPVSLMAWLVKLVTQPGGTVLDPFMGSGSTGMAARRLGFNFVGIEREPEYMEIAQRRIEEDTPLFDREAVAREDAPKSEQLEIA